MSSKSRLRKSVLMSAESVSKKGTSYTDSVEFRRCSGETTMIVISTAGSITITQQCSYDDKTWYDPYDKNGNALGLVQSSQTVTTGKYIFFNPVPSEYIRFKVVEGDVATSTVTITLITREEGA